MINQIAVSPETINDLDKYLDLRDKLNEVELTLNRMKQRLQEGTVGEGEPFTSVKSLKALKVVEEQKKELIGLMAEVFDKLVKELVPESADLTNMWINAGRGFLFKLSDEKVVIKDQKIDMN